MNSRACPSLQFSVPRPFTSLHRIAFGATVTMQFMKDKSVEEWKLVGDGEDDALDNKILCQSPMGQAMIGKKVGETVIVKAPVGDLKFKIQAIAY